MWSKIIATNNPENKEIVRLVACAVCLKIKIEEGHWEHKHHTMADMLSWKLFKSHPILHSELKEIAHQAHFNNVLVSHGLCPICYDEQMKELKDFIANKLEKE